MAASQLTYLRHSFAFRLIAIYVATFLGSVGILIAITYWVMVTQPLDAIGRLVVQEMRELSDIYKLDGEEALVETLERRAESLKEPRAFHVFINPYGRTASANLPSWPSQPRTGLFEVEADRYREGAEIDYQALSMDRVFANGARLLIGRDIEDIRDREEWLLEALAWAIGIAVFLGSVGGAFMSLAVGKRLESINLAAHKVIDGNFSGRISTAGTGDDFDKLSSTLNLMLAKIEKSLQSTSRVSDSVAHELRLPLSRLRAELEDLATAMASNQASLSMVDQALEEVDRLKSVFEALLRIARIETGRHSVRQEAIDVVNLVHDALELYQPEIDARNQRVSLDLPTCQTVYGDPDLIFQAITNLLDNAIKFAPTGGHIAVSMNTVAGTVCLCFENEGTGIPSEHRPLVTERFYRVAADDVPGIGLGLSLVDAILTAHGGHLTFRDSELGFAVEMSLPLRIK